MIQGEYNICPISFGKNKMNQVEEYQVVAGLIALMPKRFKLPR